MNSDLSPQQAKQFVAQQIAETHATARKMGNPVNQNLIQDLELAWFQLNALEHQGQAKVDEFARETAPHRPTPKSIHTNWAIVTISFTTHSTL